MDGEFFFYYHTEGNFEYYYDPYDLSRREFIISQDGTRYKRANGCMWYNEDHEEEFYLFYAKGGHYEFMPDEPTEEIAVVFRYESSLVPNRTDFLISAGNFDFTFYCDRIAAPSPGYVMGRR